MSVLYAGTASRTINPSKGIELAGYPHEPRNNVGVHDDLRVSCLYLANGSNEIVLTSFDLCYFSKIIASEIREAAASATGLPKNHIILSCTHTHSAPWTAARLDYESIINAYDYDHAYVECLKATTIELILSAINQKFPALIGMGIGRCGKDQGIGGNRRDPYGVVDDSVPVISIKDCDGNIRSIITKYTVHPTMLHADNKLVSADYPGYLRVYLQNKHKNCTVLFHQGTSGDQSPRYFRTGQTFSEAERMGTTIAKEIEQVIDQINYLSDISINVASDEIYPVLKTLPSLDEARQNINQENEKYRALMDANAEYTILRKQELAVFGAENAYGYALEKARNGYVPFAQNELPIELTAVAIGQARIIFVQGEMFAQFGLLISACGNEMTWVVMLSNGFMPGYCCTKEAIAEGGYEAGTSLLRAETGDLIAGAALRLLKELELQ